MTTPGNPFGALAPSNPFAASPSSVPTSNPFEPSSNPFALPTVPARSDSIAPAPSEDSSTDIASGINPFSGRPVARPEEEDAPHGAGGPSRPSSDEPESLMSRFNPFGSAKAAAAPSAELLEHSYLKFLINPASIAEPNKIGSYLVDGSRLFVLDPSVKANGVIGAPLFGKDPMSAIVRECSAPFNPLVPSSSAIKLLVDATAAEHAGNPVAEQIRAFEKVVRQVYRTPLSDDLKGLVEIALRRAFTLKLIDGQKEQNRGVTHSLRAHRPGLSDDQRFNPDFFANIDLMHGFATRMGTFASDLDLTYELTQALVAAKVSNIEVVNRLFDIQGQLRAAKLEIEGIMQIGIQDILRNIPNLTHREFLQDDITALIKGKVMENTVPKVVSKVAETMYDPIKNKVNAFGGLENPNSLPSLLLAINTFADGQGSEIMMDVLRKVFATPAPAGRPRFDSEVQGIILSDLLKKPGVNETILKDVFDQYLSSLASE